MPHKGKEKVEKCTKRAGEMYKSMAAWLLREVYV